MILVGLDLYRMRNVIISSKAQTKQNMGKRTQNTRLPRVLRGSFTWVRPWIVVVDVNWTHVKLKALLNGPLSLEGVFFDGPFAIAIECTVRWKLATWVSSLMSETVEKLPAWMIYANNYGFQNHQILVGEGYIVAFRFVQQLHIFMNFSESCEYEIAAESRCESSVWFSVIFSLTHTWT